MAKQALAHLPLPPEALRALIGLDPREGQREPPTPEDLAEAGIEDRGVPAEGQNASENLPF